jgi:hypothetical protein
MVYNLNNDTLDEDQGCNNAAVTKQVTVIIQNVPFIVSLRMTASLYSKPIPTRTPYDSCHALGYDKKDIL